MIPDISYKKYYIFVIMIKFRVKIPCFRLQLLTLVLFPFAASSQPASEMKKIFARAESHCLYEEYDLANQLYILLETPDNLNIKYKIGLCYLNIPDEKDKAIPYLEAAVKDAAYDAKTSKLKEKRAPLDAWFLLAIAYMINNNLDKALDTFQYFRKLARDTEMKGGMQNLGYIDQEILACRNAMEYQNNPVAMTIKTLGSDFNQGSISDNPAVSYDGNTIAFTERRGIVNVILFSKKDGDKWLPPVDITDRINAGEDCSTCSLNKDGNELFLYKIDNYDGNIYSSEYVNGEWTPVKKLNRNINTKYFESHASVSSDGERLYFTSNRDGGNGGLDIYMSEKDATGDWGPAINLGTTINTKYNEDTPFVTLNDSMLYFSSEGHSSMGGYDNFKSQKQGSFWKTPQNLGSPINTTDDDRFFKPANNGKNGYYAMTTEYKKKEIFYLNIGSTGLNKIFEIRGEYGLRDTTVFFDEKYSIHLLSKDSGDTIDVGYPNKITGRYNFIVGPGNYELIYTGVGYLSQTIDTIILQDDPDKIIDLNVVLDKDPDYKELASGYDRINLDDIPVVASVDSSIFITNMKVNDLTDNNVEDSDVLYYTVQVMALYNPVDISYFKYVDNIKVLYNETDLFYRYTTGQFKDIAEAYAHRNELFTKGYPEDIFVKKVSRIPGDKPVINWTYFTIQLKASGNHLDMDTEFRGYEEVRETKEVDGLYHYLYGRYESFPEAMTALKKIIKEDYKDAIVREIKVLVK